MIPFHSNRLMDYNKQKLFSGGYLFLPVYFTMDLKARFCHPEKSKSQHKFEYDLNAILHHSLIYTRFWNLPAKGLPSEQQNSP